MPREGRATVLVTGATGYLGGHIAREYLEQSHDDVLLWGHARDASDLDEQRRLLQRRFARHSDRIDVAAGDLTAAEPFAGIETGAIRVIVHAAADTRFNVPLPVASAVNVAGTEKLCAFARRCPRLERLALLSTVYACGLASGRILEAPCGGAAGFANHYEWSKWEAERHVFEACADLPWRLLRIATVIADDECGTVIQENAFHRTLRLFHHGLLSLLPGDPSTPLYFVTADFVAQATFALTEAADAGRVYHLAPERDRACTLDELVTAAFGVFEQDARFRRRRVLRPLYCDWESFTALLDEADAFGGPIVRQALRSVAPFGRQLYSAKDIDNTNLRAACPAYRAPEPRALVSAACASIVRSRWSRASEDGDAGAPQQEGDPS